VCYNETGFNRFGKSNFLRGYNSVMDKLDQLITKFKEAKEELEKAKIAPAAPSIIADDQARAKALGAPTNPNAPVAKEEEKDEEVEKSMLSGKTMASQMKGGGSTQLTSPGDTSRSNFYTEAMHGAYQPKAAASPAPTAKVVTKPTKLTGLDRIKAAASQPITKDEGSLSGIRKKPVTISPAVGEMPKLKEGFRAHPGAFARPASPDLHPTSTGAAVRGTAEPTRNLRMPTASGTTQAAVRGNSDITQGSHATGSSHGAIPVRAPTSLIRKEEVGPKFEKTINESTAPDVNKSCNEKLSLNKGGQWNLAVKSEDEKGRCTNCGSKACVGDCKTK